MTLGLFDYARQLYRAPLRILSVTRWPDRRLSVMPELRRMFFIDLIWVTLKD
jgi:hypothetical protein